MTSQHGGYEDQAFIAEYYDATYNLVRSKDVGFYVDYSKKANGHTLELACGTGRILIPTALAGCAITGRFPSTCRGTLSSHLKTATWWNPHPSPGRKWMDGSKQLKHHL